MPHEVHDAPPLFWRPSRDRRQLRLLLLLGVAGVMLVASTCSAQTSQRRVLEGPESKTSDIGTPLDAPVGERQSIAQVLRPVDQIEFAVEAKSRLTPTEVLAAEPTPWAQSEMSGVSRSSGKEASWEAPGLVHNPLYYEDVALERYGLRAIPGLQSPISGLGFVGHTLLLPYRMLQEPPARLNYALGHDRPGECVVPVREHPLARIRSPEHKWLPSYRLAH